MEYNQDNCNVSNCEACDTYLNRKNIVNGYGNIDAGLMIIGESPGYYEDKHGIPFIGKSGDLVNSLLNMIGLTRKDVWVTNVIKCKPPNNRAPLVSEIKNCADYLTYEIYKVNPKIIVLLGNTAIRRYFNTSLSISKIRGYNIPYNGRVVVATYHPSYVLRNAHNDNLVRGYAIDFIRIGTLYKELVNPFITFNI